MTDEEPESLLDPPLPGSWGLAFWAESTHEAHHAVTAVLLGVEILEARIDEEAPRQMAEGRRRHRAPGDDQLRAAGAGSPRRRQRPATREPELVGRVRGGAPGMAGAARDRPRPAAVAVGASGDSAVSRALLQEGALPGHRVEELVHDASRGTSP